MFGFIYLVANTLTGQGYVGQMAKQKPKLRWSEHKSAFRKGKGNKHLRNSYLLHGEAAFKFCIIDRIEACDEDALRPLLVIQEDLWMERLRAYGMSLFNFVSAAESIAGKPVSKRNKPSWNRGLTLTEEHRRAISAAKKGEPSPKKGKPQSAEQRANLSEALKGNTRRKGTATSAEGRANISAAKKGKPSPKRGTQMSPEQRIKLSEAHTGVPLSAEHRAAMKRAAQGRTWTIVDGLRVYSKVPSKESL